MRGIYTSLLFMAILLSLLAASRLVFDIDYIGILWRSEKKPTRAKNYSDLLKEQRRREILKTKPNLKERISKRVIQVIELSEFDININRFIYYSLLFSSIGIFIGMFLRNPILMVILGGLTSVIPFLYIQNKASSKYDLIEEMLPSVMGNIIAQYMHESDIVIAIEKKLDQIPQPLNRYFTACVNEVQRLNKDTATALRGLGEKVDNYYFLEFVKLAIQAEEQGQNLKYTMVTIPEDMRDVQQEQAKFDLIRKKYNREFVATIVFLPLNLMILRFGYKAYYDLLVYDIRGKISLGLIVVILIIISYKQYVDNKPIKVELD